jgi:hypothetical protein
LKQLEESEREKRELRCQNFTMQPQPTRIPRNEHRKKKCASDLLKLYIKNKYIKNLKKIIIIIIRRRKIISQTITKTSERNRKKSLK